MPNLEVSQFRKRAQARLDEILIELQKSAPAGNRHTNGNIADPIMQQIETGHD
jgi:hypothetical protein